MVSQYAFELTIEEFQGLRERALQSDNFMHRALATLDRRLGKRRLETTELRADEHLLVRYLRRFRCEAEGLPQKRVAR